MKKLFLLFLFCNLTLSGFAFSMGDMFIYNSRFWQNKLSLDLLQNEIFSTGLSFDITEHKDIDDKIYAFRAPLMLDFSILNLVLEPFIYPDISNNAQAYGGNITLTSMIKSDDINNTYAHGYLRAAFANQKANIARGTLPQNKEDFKQFAFEGGLNFNLANLYNFNFSGNIFTYPDKVKNISYFGGIMNQNELADLGTIDYVLNFPNFSLGGNIVWLSQENNTKTSIGYKYINYEHNLIAHSVMIKTIIPLREKLLTTLIYNHVFETNHKNKDLFSIGLNYLF